MAFDKLAPSKDFLCLLFLSWMAFAASIISVIVGMRLSQIADGRSVKSLANLIKEFDCQWKENSPIKPWVSACFSFNQPTHVLNWCAIGAFLFGLILLGVFVALNL
ncbi:MAG: hypothetical protein AAB425_15425, partial [Bdellovibrionota bacterium]